MLPQGTATSLFLVGYKLLKVGVVCVATRHCDNLRDFFISSELCRSGVCCHKALRHSSIPYDLTTGVGVVCVATRHCDIVVSVNFCAYLGRSGVCCHKALRLFLLLSNAQI